MDVGEAEILFAQKLACGEPRIRRKALHRLRKWLVSRASLGTDFSQLDFLKLWKGIYYCLWMQDKPLVQEELARNISDLMECFEANETQMCLWIETFYATMAREWYAIDRWRLDKFMMFMRTFLKRSLIWLRNHEWSYDLIHSEIAIWKNSVISAESSSIPEGLKYHFASIYLDELDNVMKDSVGEHIVHMFVEPYISVLANPRCSDQFFHTVISELFEAILLQRSHEFKVSTGSKNSSSPTEQDAEADLTEDVIVEPGLKIDFKAIADGLFEAAKQKRFPSNRRKTLYDLVQKYRTAAAGEDPMIEYLSGGSDLEISDSEVEVAARRLIKVPTAEEKVAHKRKQKRMRKHNDVNSDPIDDSASEVGLCNSEEFEGDPEKELQFSVDFDPSTREITVLPIESVPETTGTSNPPEVEITEDSIEDISASSTAVKQLHMKKKRGKARYFKGTDKRKNRTSQATIIPQRGSDRSLGQFVSMNVSSPKPPRKRQRSDDIGSADVDKLADFMKKPPAFCKRTVEKAMGKKR